MKLVRNIIGMLVCMAALLFAVTSASIDNWISVVASAFIITLVVPVRLIRMTSCIWAILIIVELWRITHSFASRGLDFVSQGDVFLFALSIVSFLLALIQDRLVRRCLWFASIVVVFNSVLISCVWPRHRDGPVAYLERGKWGITHTNEKKLDIKSQYSYSIIKKCLDSSDINNLDDIEKYSSLWMITPTNPFNADEILKIEQWVKAGGHLVVVSDHTDLFGHAEVLNELLKPYGMWVGKDCVINDEHSDVAYVSVAGWFSGLTGNTIHGSCCPFLLEQGYREMADYSGRSFFSDNAVTDEDRWGIYCAGAYRSYGRGRVTVFSDSTLFADFAFSRPSSQLVLRMLRDGFLMVNIPAVLFLLSVSFVLLCNRSYHYVLLAYASLSLLGVSVIRNVVSWNRSASYPLIKGVEGIKIGGNWDLVDLSGSRYSVIFAASYASDIDMPVWSPIPTHSGIVTCNGQPLLGCKDVDMVVEVNGIEEALTNSLTASKMSYVKSLLMNSYLDDVWFDAGVGLFKEYAYNNFWLSLCGRNALCPELGETRKVRMKCRMDGKPLPEMVVKIVEVLGSDGWVVVGDWMIGKRVDDEILLRKKWQHPKRQFGDAVLTPISQH